MLYQSYFKRTLLASVVASLWVFAPTASSYASGFDFCDLDISVNETEELGGLYTNIIKNCILLGVDPPPDWVPKGGRGYGVFKTHSGLQTITGKAPSLCPRLSTKDLNPCGAGIFPNCMGSPGDANSGGAKACSDADASPIQTPGNEGDVVLEDPSDITDSNMTCAIGFENGVTTNPDKFSICVADGNSFCGFDMEGDNCFGGEDGRAEGPFPSDYADADWVQVNGVIDITPGTLFGGMTGTFKMPEGAEMHVPWYTCAGEGGSDCTFQRYTKSYNIPAGAIVTITEDRIVIKDSNGSTLKNHDFSRLIMSYNEGDPSPFLIVTDGKPVLYSAGNTSAPPSPSEAATRKVNECTTKSKTQAELDTCLNTP